MNPLNCLDVHFSIILTILLALWFDGDKSHYIFKDLPQAFYVSGYIIRILTGHSTLHIAQDNGGRLQQKIIVFLSLCSVILTNNGSHK